ncbi:hypothetical protein UY3_05960 [Chelonia mydas]|uniref:Uncharacterized protein n=1 Tax=Chelonia mydas TaxID=8469 RepID=M7BG48_CHEMY|nr:hypothetical protein UY3_05960 [Chelonia mydas]
MSSVAPPSVKATADNRFVPFFRADAILVSAESAVERLTIGIERPLPLPLCSPGAMKSTSHVLYMTVVIHDFRYHSALLLVSLVLYMTAVTCRFRCNSAQLLLSRHTMASVQPAQRLCPGSRRCSAKLVIQSPLPLQLCSPADATPQQA